MFCGEMPRRWVSEIFRVVFFGVRCVPGIGTAASGLVRPVHARRRSFIGCADNEASCHPMKGTVAARADACERLANSAAIQVDGPNQGSLLRTGGDGFAESIAPDDRGRTAATPAWRTTSPSPANKTKSPKE